MEVAHANGTVRITELVHGRRVELLPHPGQWIARAQVDTTYPVSLIAGMLETVEFAWLCDEIARDEDTAALLPELFSYIAPCTLEGKRVLDFGCGTGGSTCMLARHLPNTEVLGVELNEKLLSLARLRADHYGFGERVQFVASPSPRGLPQIGDFDVIILSAVYEHLLPPERPALMRRLWSMLRHDGMLFLNQTPHRWYPIETHSTGLPLLNYLPLSLAVPIARRYSRVRSTPNLSRDPCEHLRGGLRGATERGVLKSIGDPTARLLAPLSGDRVDLWYSRLSPRYRRLKLGARLAMKAIYRLTGSVFSPNLALAISRMTVQQRRSRTARYKGALIVQTPHRSAPRVRRSL